jgi:hypothetical protein
VLKNLKITKYIGILLVGYDFKLNTIHICFEYLRWNLNDLWDG